MYCFILSLFLVSVFFNGTSKAVENDSYGNVSEITDKTIVIQIDEDSLKVGSEVEILRINEIIDPVTGKFRGKTTIPIAKGIVENFGIGKASINIIKNKDNKKVEIGDKVILTGRKIEFLNGEESIDKKADSEETLITFNPPQYGEIKEITDDTIVTSLGIEDEISEGDLFLIQRKENKYNGFSKEISGTVEINVGKLIVDTVNDTSSVTRIIEKKMEPLLTDRVVKESDYLNYLEYLQSDSLRIERLNDEVQLLKYEIRFLKSSFDSLGNEYYRQINDFSVLKNDIKTVIKQVMRDENSGLKVSLENDELIPGKLSENMLILYEQARGDCLENNLIRAQEKFLYIIRNYPDSKLIENCYYWIALSHFGLKEYSEAVKIFKEVIDDKRFTHKDDDAAIMLGITYHRINQPEKALEEFQKFILNYPNSEYSNKVKYWIKRLTL